MTDFVDELPRIKKGGRRGDEEIAAFAKDLIANPGRWAKWSKPSRSPQSVAANINRGYYPKLASGFEPAVRQKVLYVRFVGEAS